MTGRDAGLRVAALGLALGTTAGIAACGGAGSGPPPPGAPQPRAFADTLPIAEPGDRSYEEVSHLLRAALTREVGHTLSVSRRISGTGEALNVTAFDEVVPTAWFRHRIADGGMSPSRVARGPALAGPDTTGPLTVIAGKVGGVTPGFTVRDRRGHVFLIKFDPPTHPALSSGADIVSSRIFWAAGYHVPKDVVFTLDPGLLELGEDAALDTPRGERPMRPDDVIEILRRVPPLPDGRFRALASRFVEGTPKGPFRFTGTREDDPNDYYPHQHRRELRGLWVLAAWIDHVDLRFQNTLDVWVEPPGYLRHYLIDFGATLGSRSIRVANPREGREHAFDLWPVLGRWASLGLYQVGWEDEPGHPIRPSLGWIATESFDPGGWKPFWPNDAYRNVTARDGYWGAKLVAAFDRAHLRAAIREARYPDPAAADTLLDILRYRRRAILAHWYGRVTPVEDAAAAATEGGGVELRFRDLGLEEGLWSPEETRYRWRLVDEATGAARSGAQAARTRSGQRVELPLAPSGGEDGPSGPGGRGPWILELTAGRPGSDGRAATLRLGRKPDGGIRVLGLVH